MSVVRCRTLVGDYIAASQKLQELHGNEEEAIMVYKLIDSVSTDYHKVEEDEALGVTL